MNKKDTIKQVIPPEQVEIINDALRFYNAELRTRAKGSCPLNHTIYDIHQLMALLSNGEVSVELTRDKYENFSSRNGVDFPIYPSHLNSEQMEQKNKELAKRVNALKTSFDDVIECMCDGDYVPDSFSDKYPFSQCFHDLSYDVAKWSKNFSKSVSDDND